MTRFILRTIYLSWITYKSYAYIFGKMATQHLYTIHNLPNLQIDKESEFYRKHFSTKKPNASIETVLYRGKTKKSSLFRKIRISMFESENQHAFTAVWYPSIEQLPIFTLDLACMDVKNQKGVCFLNFVETDKNHKLSDAPFSNIRSQFSFHKNKYSIFLVPYTNYLSDSMVYENVNDKSRFWNDIDSLVNSYLNMYVEEIKKHHVECFSKSNWNVKDGLKEAINLRTNYNHFRRKHVDIHLFVKDYFDGKWYRDMLDEFYVHDNGDEGGDDANESDDDFCDTLPFSCML